MKSSYDLPRYTRCPKCKTTFRVSNEQLKTAGGKVRCGQCAHVFNALFALVANVPDETEAERPESFREESETLDSTSGTDFHTDTAVDTTSAKEPEIRWEDDAEAGAETLFETDSEAEAESELADNTTHFDKTLLETDAEAQSEFTLLSDEVKSQQTEDMDKTQLDTGFDAESELPQIEAVKESARDQAWDKTALETGPEDEAGVTRINDLIGTDYSADLEKTQLDTGVEATAEAEKYIEKLEAENQEGAIEYIELSGGAYTLESPFDEDENIAAEETDIGEVEREEPRLSDSIDVATVDDQLVAEHNDVPFALRESLLAADKPPRSKINLMAWGAGSLLLSIVLAMQVMVFRNTQIKQQLPALRPMVEAVCGWFDCEYTGQRNVDKIRLLNRDIRAIPNREGVLQVITTMVNDAPFAQPYPEFEIVLSDLGGTLVAHRRFLPDEYLGDLGREHPLMKPGIPVQVQLEVLDPGDDAVNFEINFF